MTTILYVDKRGNADYVAETKFDYEMIPWVGKTVFLTKSEAEQSLVEMKGE